MSSNHFLTRTEQRVSRRIDVNFALVVVALLGCLFEEAYGQSRGQSSEASQTAATAITVRSNLVLVPVLVKDKTGEPVLSLNAGDFILTDNGVPQSVRMELDTDSQPMALAVIVETGREGALHLGDYRNLGVALDAVIGNVPRHIAVIGFDSKPHLERYRCGGADRRKAAER